MTKKKFIRFCDLVIEWAFYTLPITITFSTSLVEIASSTMIVVWILKKAIDRDFVSIKTIPWKLILAILLWTVLSCINSDFFKESFRGIFKVAEYMLIFVIAATELGKANIVRRFPYAIIIGVVVSCLNGIYQYIFGIGLIRHRELISQDYVLRRISSSFPHPNGFGVYLLVACVVLLALALSKNNILREKVALFFVFALSLGCLFLTKSRGAWLSFSAALLVFGALKAKKLVAIFLALLLVIFIMLPYTVQEHIFNLTDFEQGTTWERLMLWKGTVNMIREHPILGFGVNTYSKNFPAFRPENYPDVRYSHNCYLHMASEVGIVGAVLFLFFLVTVLTSSLGGALSMPRGKTRDLSIGLFAGLVGFALNCMVDTHLYSVNLAVFFYLLLGFCYSFSCNRTEECAPN